jgi:hypothetical protein
MRHALVDANGIVVNVIELEPDANWRPPQGCSVVPSETADIGDMFDHGHFVAAPRARNPVIDGVTFLARVNDAEYTAVMAAAQQDVQVARWIEMLRLLGEIDLTGDTSRAAKAGLVARDLLTAERADVIFAA